MKVEKDLRDDASEQTERKNEKSEGIPCAVLQC